MISEQFLLPLVVIGLVAFTLVMSSVARRYQQYQAARRSVVQRMEYGIREVRHLLQQLDAVPLPVAVRQALRTDVVDRYRMIGRVFRRYPDLAHLQAEAEAAVGGEAEAQRPVPVVLGDAELAPLLKGLDETISYLGGRGTLHPVPEDELQALVGQLADCRAELLAQHHHAHYRELAAQDDLPAARGHLLRLIEALRASRPTTARLRELESAAVKALDQDPAAVGKSAGDSSALRAS